MTTLNLTDKLIFEVVLSHWLVDGYPATTCDIVQSLSKFDEKRVGRALERASVRGKIVQRGLRWMPPTHY